MTCCSAIACSCLIWRRARASRTRVARSGCIARPITAGRRRSTGRAWRCSARASGAGRRCPTSSRSMVEQRIVAFCARASRARPAADRGTAGAAGVGRTGRLAERRLQGAVPPRAEHARQAPGVGRGLPRALSSRRASPRPSRTSTAAGRASWSGSTASSSAACTAPRARSGSSPRSTPTARSRGPIWSSRRRPARPSSRPPRSPAASPQSSKPPAGDSNACSQTTATSSAAASSARGCPTGARHSQIRSGRPQTNGHVERLHRTILEECWRPAFARYLQVRFTGLRRDLAHYLHDYNHDRDHHGRITQGRRPADLVYGARKMEPR